jgi:hypothetical protein
VIPWVGGNAGSHNASGVIDVGATVGVTAASVIDVDVDLGYSPDFFGNSLNSYVLTTMGNLTVGIPFGGTRAPRFRPYLTGGVGLIRARLEDDTSANLFTEFDLGPLHYWRTSTGLVLR